MVNHVTQLPSAFQGTLSLKQCMLGVGKGRGPSTTQVDGLSARLKRAPPMGLAVWFTAGSSTYRRQHICLARV